MRVSGSNPLRVLHVAHGWPPREFGGTELYAAAVAEAQARAGALVTAWTSRDLPRRPRPFRDTFTNAEAEADFERVCRAHRAEVVHIHHLSGASFGLCASARALGARVVFTLHDFWLACARGQLVDLDDQRCEGPELDRCARCLAPALWAPAPVAVARRLPLRRAPLAARRAALAALVGHVDRFLSPSRHLPARVGVPATWLPYPLLRPIAPAPPAPPGPVRFLFVGSLIPTKAPHVALEAFAGLPAGAATLHVVGPSLGYRGNTRYADAIAARARGIPGVTLEGPAAPDRIPELLAAHDVLLFPSTWLENSPFVLHEAAAAGLRIVASDIPGAAEVLGDTGVRAEAGDVASWRRALAAEIRRGRARNPPSIFPDLDTHAAELIALYRKLPGIALQ